MSKEETGEPEYKVDIWINARDQAGHPCTIHPFGFEIEAFSSDYLQMRFKGTKDFPEGAWVTTEDLEKFAEKLMQIVERLHILPVCNSQGVNVLWEKEADKK